jgi:enoyl-[acyl-carrier protein] reductase I
LFFLFVLFLAFRLPDGSLMEITKVYPLDAVFDNPDDVPEDV